MLRNRINLILGIEGGTLHAINILSGFYKHCIFLFVQLRPVTGHQHHIILRDGTTCAVGFRIADKQLFASLVVNDGFSVPIKWSYSNTNSYEHPIIKILMKRISVAADGNPQMFKDWFPEQVNNKDTVNYILDNGWNKPRDIVRFLIAAQNDSLHCNDTSFTQAAFDTLRKEYSKNSLTEIRQELQSLYTSEEIEIVMRLLRGGPRIVNAEMIRKRAPKGSKARVFWDERKDDILEDFYRVGFWGNVNRNGSPYAWRWNHKGDTGVLTDNGWELAIHNALCSELSIIF